MTTRWISAGLTVMTLMAGQMDADAAARISTDPTGAYLVTLSEGLVDRATGAFLTAPGDVTLLADGSVTILGVNLMLDGARADADAAGNVSIYGSYTVLDATAIELKGLPLGMPPPPPEEPAACGPANLNLEISAPGTVASPSFIPSTSPNALFYSGGNVFTVGTVNQQPMVRVLAEGGTTPVDYPIITSPATQNPGNLLVKPIAIAAVSGEAGFYVTGTIGPKMFVQSWMTFGNTVGPVYWQVFQAAGASETVPRSVALQDAGASEPDVIVSGYAKVGSARKVFAQRFNYLLAPNKGQVTWSGTTSADSATLINDVLVVHDEATDPDALHSKVVFGGCNNGQPIVLRTADGFFNSPLSGGVTTQGLMDALSAEGEPLTACITSVTKDYTQCSDDEPADLRFLAAGWVRTAQGVGSFVARIRNDKMLSLDPAFGTNGVRWIAGAGSSAWREVAIVVAKGMSSHYVTLSSEAGGPPRMVGLNKQGGIMVLDVFEPDSQVSGASFGIGLVKLPLSRLGVLTGRDPIGPVTDGSFEFTRVH